MRFWSHWFECGTWTSLLQTKPSTPKLDSWRPRSLQGPQETEVLVGSAMNLLCSDLWPLSGDTHLSGLSLFRPLTLAPFLRGTDWSWRGRPCTQWWRRTGPGWGCSSCRPLRPPPRQRGRTDPADTAENARSAPRDGDSKAGTVRRRWWASVGWWWSGRTRLQTETNQNRPMSEEMEPRGWGGVVVNDENSIKNI